MVQLRVHCLSGAERGGGSQLQDGSAVLMRLRHLDSMQKWQRIFDRSHIMELIVFMSQLFFTLLISLCMVSGVRTLFSMKSCAMIADFQDSVTLLPSG